MIWTIQWFEYSILKQPRKVGQGCEWTNWINQIEGNMDYTLKEGQAIRGVKTEWNDDKG